MQDTIYGLLIFIRMIKEFPLPTIILILLVIGCFYPKPQGYIKDDKGNRWEFYRWPW